MKNIKKQIIMTAAAVFMGIVGFAQTTTFFQTLTSQAEVDSFNFTGATGNITISGDNITNLTNLNGLTFIGRDLRIQSNPNLTSLAGLEALTSVAGLIIRSSPKLTNLRGLDNLTRATTLVAIFNNRALTSLQGLEKLTAIGSTIIGSLGLSIYSNAILSTLNGLNSLTALGGNLLIGTSSGTDVRLNPLLTNFCAISQLVSGDTPIAMNKYFVVNDAYNPTHAQLGNAVTCMNSSTLDTSLTLTMQTEIDDIVPYSEITGSVTISETVAGTITSLSGLVNITSIRGNLEILDNLALTSLEGLGNLETLGGQLQIGTTNRTTMNPNAALVNFCAISGLVSEDMLQIVKTEDNTNEYFVANNGYNPSYAGLASGRVEESAANQNDGCSEFVAVVSTNTFSKEEDGYRLFPNPVKDILFVKSESKITSITISNLSGQTVLKSNSASIHVRNLSKGIYFARIVSGEKTVVEKFVKL